MAGNDGSEGRYASPPCMAGEIAPEESHLLGNVFRLEDWRVAAIMTPAADVAYIDRSNNAAAREGLEPAVEALRNGRSIAIAPEGTRSPTPRLLPFKKGPFHLAMQAGVPVVPIVMRNCGEIMAAHSMAIHGGTVDVAVLPPVPTDDWTLENLNENIARVRQMYLDTLADWPTQ